MENRPNFTEIKEHLSRLEKLISENSLPQEELFKIYLELRRIRSFITGEDWSPNDVYLVLKLYFKDRFGEFLNSLESPEKFRQFLKLYLADLNLPTAEEEEVKEEVYGIKNLKVELKNF